MERVYLNNPPGPWESVGKDIEKGLICWFVIFSFPIFMVIYLFLKGGTINSIKDSTEIIVILIICTILVIMGFIILNYFRKSDDWKIEFSYDSQFYEKVYAGLIKMLRVNNYNFKIDERLKNTLRKEIEIKLSIHPSLKLIYGTKNGHDRNPSTFEIQIEKINKDTLMHADQLAREITYVLENADYKKYVIIFGDDNKT